MKDVLIISSLLIAIQFANSYLRYLPFSRGMNRDETRRLWKSWIICGIICYLIIITIFMNSGISAINYKLILLVNWIPPFIISMKVVPRSKWQYFLVLGMTLIWTLIIHSLTAFIDAILIEWESRHLLFLVHSTIYLSILILLLPIERRIFIGLLPDKNFFENQPYGRYIVFLPFIVTSSVLILWIDGEMFHSWQERISRMYLPFTFFLFYRYVLTANLQILNQRREIRLNQRLKEQLESLKEFNLILQRNQEQVRILRHDMRHNYRLIYAMLEDGKIAEVLDHIKVQDRLLDSTSVKIFCHAPLVNAALSIYLNRAEDLGIRISHKINLPRDLRVDESDFAILISNLLENAIHASLNQSIDRREIKITIEHIETQYVLEVTNLFDFEVQFDSNGYPITDEDGHGIGMASLKNFVAKYNAQLDFSHESNIVRVMVYWEDF